MISPAGLEPQIVGPGSTRVTNRWPRLAKLDSWTMIKLLRFATVGHVPTLHTVANRSKIRATQPTIRLSSQLGSKSGANSHSRIPMAKSAFDLNSAIPRREVVFDLNSA
jgi:hypothetical protein